MSGKRIDNRLPEAPPAIRMALAVRPVVGAVARCSQA
jgi:hypothetical protein